jgi:hypothetical protein
MDPTPISSLVDVSLQGKAGEILPALLGKIKKHWGRRDGT